MKKILMRIILAAVIALAAAGGCAAESAAPEPAADGAVSEWTVLFYLCGSDLESRYSYATAALTDISQVTYPYDFRKLYTQHDTDRSELMRDIGNVNVLIETGGAREWHAQELNLDISPAALQRWRLNYRPVATGEGNRTERPKEKIELLETLPLKSMGEAETLAVMAGRRYRLLYPLNETQNAKEKSYAASEELTMLRYVKVSEMTLPAGTYYLEYEVQDMFMRRMVLEKIPFRWDGEKMTFGYDESPWEGTIVPAWSHK